MTLNLDPVHVVLVVLFDSAEGGAQHELAIRTHWMLHNNPSIASCTVLAVMQGAGAPTPVEEDRQYLLDRRLVSKVTCGGALRATLEPIAQKDEMAIVVLLSAPNEQIASDIEPVKHVERLTMSYGFDYLRAGTGDDVYKEVIHIAARLTAILVSRMDLGDDKGITLVATSRKRLVGLSPHLPLTKYLMYDVESRATLDGAVDPRLPGEDDVGAIPQCVTLALVKASDFMVRMDMGDDEHHTITPVFSTAFDRFRYLTESRKIRWSDSLPLMVPVFDRNAMGAMMESVAKASNEQSLGLTVRTTRSWEILGHESDISDLVYPCLIKSRAACGVPESHQMALVLREEGMIECDMEGQLVVQEFINHGGVLFKVYVGRNGFRVDQRDSIPDIVTVTPDMPSIIEFDSLHGLPTRLPWIPTGTDEPVRVPDDEFFTKLVAVARDVVRLSLFGIDVVRRGNDIVIIDINYLPRLFEGALE